MWASRSRRCPSIVGGISICSLIIAALWMTDILASALSGFHLLDVLNCVTNCLNPREMRLKVPDSVEKGRWGQIAGNERCPPRAPTLELHQAIVHADSISLVEERLASRMISRALLVGMIERVAKLLQEAIHRPRKVFRRAVDDNGHRSLATIC